MNPIFISYRRADSRKVAIRLYKAIARHHGVPKPFLDEVGIQAGQEFPEVLATKLNNSSALVALIGPQWASLRDTRGRRLHLKHDYVAQEIERALDRGILILPVLVGGALIPRRSDLQKKLHPLLKRQFLDMSQLTFAECVKTLIERVREEGNHLVLRQRSKYSGKDRKGTKWWKWWAWLDGPREQLDAVLSVDYHLHRKTYDEPIIEVTDRRSKFRFDDESYDTFHLKAVAYRGIRRKTVFHHELVLK